VNRIDQRFRALRALGKKGFIAYIAAGDPTLPATAALALELERVGVDVLELGVPFSDPLADGVVNQLAAERALRGGTTLPGVLKMVAGLRRRGFQLPVVFYIYFNLILHYGVKQFAQDAAAAGVDGVLALDLPPEEADGFEQTIRQAGLHLIYLIAPTTPEDRIRQIARHASGFIYYVSREGVTGMQPTMGPAVTQHIATIRRHSTLPVAIGFGISNPAQARAAAQSADAVVVGSAIVNQIAKHGRDRRMPARVARFVGTLTKAVGVVMVAALLAGCSRREAPSVPLTSWPRPAFQPTGNKALIWYQIYGHFPDSVDISRGKYRCAGVPDGIALEHYYRVDHEPVVTAFLKQPFFATALRRELPGLAIGVESAPELTVIRGEVPEAPNLDYLRDVVGLVTWFLDNGGLAVLDPQTLQWYGRDKWRSELFEPNAPNTRQHVVILVSEDKDGLWLHTRGMRKFARPDLSIRSVPAAQRDEVIAVLNRLIESEGSGQPAAPGQLTGSVDDPDFNNTHIELGWPP
jgi:tryptophan synthase alpha chain